MAAWWGTTPVLASPRACVAPASACSSPRYCVPTRRLEACHCLAALARYASHHLCQHTTVCLLELVPALLKP
ncbi:hypothetical protein E2562_009156, partial [Oryza meyeriana var. granulata]